MASKVGIAVQVLITTATVCVVSLVLMTLVAIDRSRDRTACYKATQMTEGCSTPSWWEEILRRNIGPGA